MYSKPLVGEELYFPFIYFAREMINRSRFSDSEPGIQAISINKIWGKLNTVAVPVLFLARHNLRVSERALNHSNGLMGAPIKR